MIRKPGVSHLTCLVAAAVLAASVGVPATAVTASASTQTAFMIDSHGNATKHDITFIAMMVHHHQMGIEMARMAKKKASTDQVRKLAAHIDQVQTGQVGEMKAWLKRHHAAPMEPSKTMRAMEHQDLEMLRTIKGHEFDAMFLMMMRSHHAQAVSEAEDELCNGRSEFALHMARDTKTGQTREIALMNKMLAPLHRQMHSKMHSTMMA